MACMISSRVDLRFCLPVPSVVQPPYPFDRVPLASPEVKTKSTRPGCGISGNAVGRTLPCFLLHAAGVQAPEDHLVRDSGTAGVQGVLVAVQVAVEGHLVFQDDVDSQTVHVGASGVAVVEDRRRSGGDAVDAAARVVDPDGTAL